MTRQVYMYTIESALPVYKESFTHHVCTLDKVADMLVDLTEDDDYLFEFDILSYYVSLPDDKGYVTVKFLAKDSLGDVETFTRILVPLKSFI